MTDPMPTIMQAAERLRRVNAGEDPAKVYPECPHSLVDMQADEGVLADFALSILPKGERPVAIERVRECVFDDDANEFAELASAWAIDDDGDVVELECHCVDCQPHDWNAYATEADALLALHWRKFDALASFTRPFCRGIRT